MRTESGGRGAAGTGNDASARTAKRNEAIGHFMLADCAMGIRKFQEERRNQSFKFQYPTSIRLRQRHFGGRGEAPSSNRQKAISQVEGSFRGTDARLWFGEV